MVNKISFKNYKVFKNRQVLEIKPITVVIGKNNSGKSAIVKLPTLIAGSLSGVFAMPLRWENEGVRLGESYEDLVYNKFIADFLEFEIADNQEKLSVILSSDTKSKVFFLKYELNDEVLLINKDIKKEDFRGFTIKNAPLKSLSLKFDYIGPFRKIPTPTFNNIFDDFEKIGIEGENAYPILIQLSNNNDPLFYKINEWYKANFEGWKLKINQITGLTQTYEIGLEHNGLKGINISNVGQGIHQALPLIVRSFMPIEEDSLIIIEEPETHLHPAAHGNLAERFVDSYLDNSHRHYLIETHSQNFVLRLRRLVAEGKLNANDLAIYYVDFEKDNNESTLKRIMIDQNGDLPNNDWPEGVFNETSLETRAIYNAQINNLQDVD